MRQACGVVHQRHALLARGVVEQPTAARQQLVEVEVDGLEFEVAGFDARHVEHVVDDVQQVLRSIGHAVDAPGLCRVGAVAAAGVAAGPTDGTGPLRPQRLALQDQAVAAREQTVEDRIGDGRFAQMLVPERDR